jgi:hypothetical protein
MRETCTSGSVGALGGNPPGRPGISVGVQVGETGSNSSCFPALLILLERGLLSRGATDSARMRGPKMSLFSLVFIGPASPSLNYARLFGQSAPADNREPLTSPGRLSTMILGLSRCRPTPLETYARLRSPAAVLRRMVRGVSTRDYGDVIDLTRDGFGVQQSSVDFRAPVPARHVLAAAGCDAGPICRRVR